MASPSSPSSATADPLDRFTKQLDALRETSPSSSVILSIINQALANSTVYAGFLELKMHPVVQAGATANSGMMAAAVRTLDLFATGIYRDYTSAKQGTFLPLTEAQRLKLQFLTVVSLVHATVDATRRGVSGSGEKPASRRNSRRHHGGAAAAATAKTTAEGGGCGTISYAALQKELGIPENSEDGGLRDLEDILIQCLYAGVIAAKLDQRNMCLVVDASAGSSSSSSSSALSGSAATSSSEQEDGGAGNAGGSAAAGSLGVYGHYAGAPMVLSRDVTDIAPMIQTLEAFKLQSDTMLAIIDELLVRESNMRVTHAQGWETIDMLAQEVRQRVTSTGVTDIPSGGGLGWGAGEAVSAAAATVAHTLERYGGLGARRQSKRSRGGGGGENLLRF